MDTFNQNNLVYLDLWELSLYCEPKKIGVRPCFWGTGGLYAKYNGSIYLVKYLHDKKLSIISGIRITQNTIDTFKAQEGIFFI